MDLSNRKAAWFLLFRPGYWFGRIQASFQPGQLNPGMTFTSSFLPVFPEEKESRISSLRGHADETLSLGVMV